MKDRPWHWMVKAVCCAVALLLINAMMCLLQNNSAHRMDVASDAYHALHNKSGSAVADMQSWVSTRGDNDVMDYGMVDTTDPSDRQWCVRTHNSGAIAGEEYILPLSAWWRATHENHWYCASGKLPDGYQADTGVKITVVHPRGN